jgi:hypothetical protein
MSAWIQTSDTSDNETARLGVFGTFVVALALGITLSFLWVGELRRVAAAPGWPTVDGRVTSASIQDRGRKGSYADVIADIEYVVNGVKHERFAIEIATGVRRADALAKLPARGAIMKVWYDPSDPSRSTLTSDWTASHTSRLLILIGCAGVVIITLPILIWRLKQAFNGVLHGVD